MKFKFWHKMTTIFGFLDEKCIRMDICSITSWLHPIIMSLELSQLYRDLYGKMAFWPQWRHQLGAANLWQATVAEEKQLLSCVFFCSSGFFQYFLPFWYWKWWQFPFKGEVYLLALCSLVYVWLVHISDIFHFLLGILFIIAMTQRPSNYHLLSITSRLKIDLLCDIYSFLLWGLSVYLKDDFANFLRT